MEVLQQLFRAAPQGDKVDPLLVENVQVGVGGELRVKDQLLGEVTSALLPKFDEAKDFIVLHILTQIGIGVAEDALFTILCEEGQHTLLGSATLGNVVFLDQVALAMKRDCVEIQIKGDAPLQAQLGHGIKSQAHKLRMGLWLDTAAILREEGALWDHIETGE